MIAKASRSGLLDRLAIGLSGLCLAHCLLSFALVAVLASAGSFLLDPSIHEVGLVIAVLLGVVALGRGIALHGFMLPSAIGGLGLGVMAGALAVPHGGGEIAIAAFGVLLVAMGHDLNRRAGI